MKKFVSLIIAALLVCNVSVGALADGAQTDVTASEVQISYEAQIVSDLGLYTVSSPDEYVARNDVVASVVRLSGIAQSGSAEKIFYDVPVNSPYAPYVTSAYELGYLDIVHGGRFNGSAAVGYAEIKRYFACVLGYKDFVNTPSYNSILGKFKFLKNVRVNNSNSVTQDEFAKLLYEILDEEIAGGNGKGLGAEKGSSVLQDLLNLKRTEGVADSTYFSSLSGVSAPTADKTIISVDGKRFKYNGENPELLLGLNVEVFYSDDRTATPTLVAVGVKDNEVVTIDDVSLDRIESGEVRYYDGKKNVKEKLTGREYIICNDEAHPTFDLKTLSENGFNGKIELISNDSGKDFEVVKVYSYKNYLVKGATADGKISVGRENELLDFSKYENLLVKDTSGKEVRCADLQKDDVLTVYDTFGKNSVKAIVSKDRIEEFVDSVNTEKSTVEIGGRQYDVDCDFFDRYSENRIFRGEGTVLLDACGKVAHIDFANSTGWKWGLVIGAMTEGGLSPSYKLKIIDIDSKIGIYSIPKKLYLDGEKKSNDTVFANLTFADAESGKQYAKRQLLKFVANSNGNITDIDTPTKTAYEDDTSNDSKTVSGLIYTGNDGSNYLADANYRVAMNAKYFGVPTDSKMVIERSDLCFSDNKYVVSEDSALFSRQFYRATLPEIIVADIDDASIAGIVVVPEVYSETEVLGGTGGFLKTCPYLLSAMVDYVYLGIDENGDERTYLRYFIANSTTPHYETSVVSSPNVVRKQAYDENDKAINGVTKPLHRGDVIKLGIGLNGELRAVMLDYDVERTPNKQFTANNNVIVGVAYASNANGARILTKVKGGAPAFDGNNADAVFDFTLAQSNRLHTVDLGYVLSFGRAATYDRERDVITVTRYDDLLDYVSGASNLPVMCCRYNTLGNRFVCVIK